MTEVHMKTANACITLSRKPIRAQAHNAIISLNSGPAGPSNGTA